MPATTETTSVIIPKDFRCWFDGKQQITIEVYDIDETSIAGPIGTIKTEVTPSFLGAMTFAVRKSDKGQWHVVR
jgi:hypothetical protein